MCSRRDLPSWQQHDLWCAEMPRSLLLGAMRCQAHRPWSSWALEKSAAESPASTALQQHGQELWRKLNLLLYQRRAAFLLDKIGKVKNQAKGEWDCGRHKPTLEDYKICFSSDSLWEVASTAVKGNVLSVWNEVTTIYRCIPSPQLFRWPLLKHTHDNLLLKPAAKWMSPK